MNKRILLVTQYFYPENFKSNDIAFELVKLGYDVDALVSIPNYPQGKYYTGYGITSKRFEKINGVRVLRVFQTPRGKKATGFCLLLNYVTYAFFASAWAFIIYIFKRKYSSIIVFQNSPITQAVPAILLGNLSNTPVYIWIQDLWPEALVSGGNINNKHIVSIVDKFSKWVYNNSNRILVSSKLFANAIAIKGNYEKKLLYFPNWCDDFLKKSIIDLPNFPSGFIITLAGNLGVSQDLESIVKLAIELMDLEDVKIVLLGDGSKKKWIEKEIERLKLHNNLYCLGMFPYEMMPSFYRKSNAMLLTLNSKFQDLKMVVPSRLQSYMSAARPVLGMIEGGAADIINEANCGYVVNGSDYLALAKIIKEIILTDRQSFERLGLNGRKYYEMHFQKDNCIKQLCNIIENR